jgi:replication factor C small subunit
MKEFLFVEKYAPTTVDDCILPVSIKSALLDFKDSGEIPNLILTGSPGLGKTSSIKALANELDLDLLFINGSNEGRLIDTIRDKVIQFCTTVSMRSDGHNKKMVLIDEFDNTLDTVQLALRGVIEEYQSNVTFVFTVNNYEKVLPAIVSRCSTINYKIPKYEYKPLLIQITKRLYSILDTENIEYDRNVLISIVKQLFPDIRRIFNEVQRYSSSGVLDISSVSLLADNDIDKLIEYMKTKQFENIRIWVNDHMDTSPQRLFRLLYNALRGTLNDVSIANAILLIADYQHKATAAVDQEINFLSCVIEITYNDSIKFK